MIKFVTVTQNKLLEFIETAKEKIVIAKPSYKKTEILVILDVINNSNMKNKLYIESGDKTIRYGFGETEAIKMINDNLSVLNVQTVGRIRLSIVVIDNETLIYAPNILFMEDETTDLTFPNGILGDEEITDMILKEIYYEDEEGTKNIDESILNNKKVIPFPKCEIEGRNSQEVKCNLEDMNLFKDELNKILSKYLQNTGRFGQIIKVEDKKKFSSEIEQLEKEFLNFIQGKVKDKIKNRFCNQTEAKQNTKKNMNDFLKTSKEELKNELIETCKNDEGFINNMFKRDRYLKNKVKNNDKTIENAKEEFIKKFIENELKFPDIDEIIQKINIKVDYYDISDELLNNNEDFRKVIKRLDIECREYGKGYIENNQ